MKLATNPPPALTDDDLRDRLQEMYRTAHRSHLVAMAGDARPMEVQTDIGAFRVVPVRSELDLRKQLAQLDDEDRPDPHVVFLVPWTGSLPIDLGGRFANGGRIVPQSRDGRLRTVFGATVIDDDVRASKLAQWLVAAPQGVRYPTKGGRLTLEAAMLEWLRAECRAFEHDFSLIALLGWAALDAGGPALCARLQGELGVELRAEIVRFLEQRLGPAAPVVWRAWEAGSGARLLELAVLFEALAGSVDQPAVRVWYQLKLQAEGVSEDRREPVFRALASAADPALRSLRARGHARATAEVAAAADRLVDLEEVRRASVRSRWLPSAWTAATEALGQALREASAAPSVALLERAVRQLRDLENHENASAPTIERAEMACRLLGWLTSRWEERYPAQLNSFTEVHRLARWYAHEGGFVDWARRAARGTATNAFGEGVMAVVAAADAERCRMDRLFAKALPSWLAARRPTTHVLPIHQALDRFVVRPLATPSSASSALVPNRRFLVLLLDGMAWAQAVELLESMTGWGPVAWNADARSSGIEVAPSYIPVLAHLPTMTEVSRASFFAGKDLPAGRHESTEKDLERFRDHPLRRFFAEGDLPRLLLRAEGHTSDGAASSEAISEVRDTSRPVVAMVINAIDASLKSDAQQVQRWKVQAIKSLGDLLDAARLAGRAVLLASDHGHVPSDLLANCGDPHDASPRWRAWDGVEEVKDYEVAIPKTLAWAPRGAEGVVLLADDQHRYGGSTYAGEHGGATLAEVVAPTVLIGYDTPGVPAAMQDPQLRVGARFQPRWWYYEIDPVREGDRAAPAPAPAARQLTLIESEPLAAMPAPKRSRPEELPLHPLAVALGQSHLFKERTLEAARRKTLLQVVSYLASRDDHSATIASFANQLSMFATRAQGFVAALAEWLNVDGYILLWHDPQTQRVHLDVAKLQALYELP